MDIVHPSSVRLSDYTNLFCAKGLLVGAALRFVLLLTTNIVIDSIREAKERSINIVPYSGKDEEDLMLIAIGNMNEREEALLIIYLD